MKIKEKVYQPKVGKKIKWYQTLPYQLGDSGKDFPFNISVLSKTDEILEQHVVNIPSSILENWDSDEIITNYLLSVIGVELDLDNTVDLVLEKLNSGTITYSSGTQEENDLILKTYANFIALNIESYKQGSIELNEIPTITGFDVSIELGVNAFDIISFVQEIVDTPQENKTAKLNDCITTITAIVTEEN